MKFRIQNSELKIKESGFNVDDLIKVLLKNRGIKTKKEKEEFLNPTLENVTVKSVGIDTKNLKKAVDRIRIAIKNKEQIVVFGDYDVDGITGTAILWETLNSLGAKVSPYIPHRIEEGYGLSETGIKNLKLKIKNCSLIITVDNGIVANKAVDFTNKNGIDVIITDHHVSSKTKPKAYAIVHTTKLCGAGVAWLLSQQIRNPKAGIRNDHLELVGLATVADMVPLVSANRSLLTAGLLALRQTKRVGLLELLKEAGIEKEKIGVYEIGHIVAPRLNATGRMEYAMDSLRLLCTNDRSRAETLAGKLGRTNKERQLLTVETTHRAIESIKSKKELKKLLFVVHESYQQGVIGLVAGRLVEEFYRPAIVISRGEKFSKASARSVKGFNIVEFIRSASEFLVDVGGHPMAAGFTIETKKLSLFEKALHKSIGNLLTEEILEKKLRIDCEIPLSFIDKNLYKALQKLSPFGVGNPEPTFISRNIVVEDLRLVGAEGKHIKFRFRIYDSLLRESFAGQVGFMIEGIAFGMRERAKELRIGDKVDVVYVVNQNEWNGNTKLELKIKDIVVNQFYL
ncbi:MAG: single-stranded-DNA-specific exonuclease RecJ [Candidatus Levybacteria bacterium]|nr:single-stranded-DNA-specific exonuclease RecJ [Candidatus Levybacteria bacterium]